MCERDRHSSLYRLLTLVAIFSLTPLSAQLSRPVFASLSSPSPHRRFALLHAWCLTCGHVKSGTFLTTPHLLSVFPTLLTHCLSPFLFLPLFPLPFHCPGPPPASTTSSPLSATPLPPPLQCFPQPTLTPLPALLPFQNLAHFPVSVLLTAYLRALLFPLLSPLPPSTCPGTISPSACVWMALWKRGIH